MALGRSSLMQHWLARSDGFVVVVEESTRVLSAKSGETVPVDFRLTNVTSEPVEVLGIRTGCGCTTAQPIPCTIAAHSTQTVTLTVSMQNRSPGEPFEMSPELYLDRPARKFHEEISAVPPEFTKYEYTFQAATTLAGKNRIGFVLGTEKGSMTIKNATLTKKPKS